MNYTEFCSGFINTTVPCYPRTFFQIEHWGLIFIAMLVGIIIIQNLDWILGILLGYGWLAKGTINKKKKKVIR